VLSRRPVRLIVGAPPDPRTLAHERHLEPHDQPVVAGDRAGRDTVGTGLIERDSMPSIWLRVQAGSVTPSVLDNP